MWFCVTLVAIIFFLVLLLTFFHYTTDGRKYWKKRNVPYREPCPIFGNFGPTLLAKLSYADMLQKFYNNNYNEKYFGLFQARRPTLMIIDLNVAKNVFSKDFSCFSDRISVNTDTQREPLLRNLANMSGTEWKEMRHIVSPTFSSAKMKAMFPLVAECAHNLQNTLLREPRDKVDIPKLMTRYTTDVIGSCAFGVDPCSLKNPDSPFLIMSQKMFKATRSAILKRYCRTFFPRLFKFLNLTSYSPDVAMFFSDIINQVLTERRTKGIERADFLQLMLNVQTTETGFPMTDELITSNSFIFMLAGLETSATTLSFCLYQLAKDQELQDRLREEIMECLKEHDGLHYESVAGMKLCTMTVLETLRMYPPTPFTSRLCTAPCTLSGTDLEMKVKDAVLIPFHCMQMDPKYFSDPEKFDPERFSENHSPQGFMAFGDGPRSCPGARFAQIAVVAGLAAMLSTMKVEPCAKTTDRVEYDPRSVMLKNKGGIWLKFTPL